MQAGLSITKMHQDGKMLPLGNNAVLSKEPAAHQAGVQIIN